MTKQQIFNNVWRTFIIEKAPQAIDGIVCKYRLAGTKGCAIGCQIPDELYDPNMEGCGIHQVFSRFPKAKEYFGGDNFDFMLALQDAHDCHFSHLKERLKDIAIIFDLYIPECDRCHNVGRTNQVQIECTIGGKSFVINRNLCPYHTPYIGNLKTRIEGLV